MLRLIIGAKRRLTEVHVDSDDNGSNIEQDEAENCLEPWVDFIKRTTRDAEERLRHLDIEEWISIQRKRKWNFAQRVALQSSSRWTHIVAKWQPELTSIRTSRPQGHPKKRWHDDIEKFLKSALGKDSVDWMQVAEDKVVWRALESDYIKAVTIDN